VEYTNTGPLESPGRARASTSLLAAMVGVHGFQGTRWTVAGELGRAQGNHHPSICPYGLFRTRDGAVQIAVGSERLWKRFCMAFRIDPETSGMADNGQRVAHRNAVIRLVESKFAAYDCENLLNLLAGAGIPAGRVRSIDEVYEWEQTRSQGLVIDVDHATVGPVRLAGPPLRFFDWDREISARMHRPPPVLDEHGDQIREWVKTLGSVRAPAVS